jgi:hypothetical protein
MRFPSARTMTPLIIGAIAAAVFGWLAPRDVLMGWLTAVAPLAAGAVGAALLTFTLKLGRSRLFDVWQIPLSIAAPWLLLAPVLCLPLVFGVDTLYGWRANDAFAAQRGYLNVPFFVVRTIICFAAGIGVATWLRRASRPFHLALGLLIAFVVANAMGIDWIMALTPKWHSSDFGLRWCVNGLSVAAPLAVAWQAIDRPGTSEDELRARIDGATLLFALDLGWLYLIFIDYITAWSGNLPEETIWYGPRAYGVWGIVIAAVVTLHVIIGLLLLSRLIKRSPKALLGVAVVMILAQWIEVLWTVIPGTGANAGIVIAVSALSLAVAIGASLAWCDLFRRSPVRIVHG